MKENKIIFEVLMKIIKNDKNSLLLKAKAYDTASELIKSIPMSSTEAKKFERTLTNSLDYIR
jgi:hypothetical protein